MTNRQTAIKIIKQLRSEGFEALLAGGCVRDMLIGRRAKDYDVATNATPREIIKLFKRTIKVGAQFGVVIVLLDDQQVEVATFRNEIGYEDGRHPSSIKFVSMAEDAKRRDFTINGMFYDPVEKKVIDYVDGQADLERESIRTIGEPKERFGEDYLRMLRAVRFSAQLGFAIERRTWLAIRNNAKSISKISGERIAMELEGILTNPNRAAGAVMLVKSGLAETIFPGFDMVHTKPAIDVLRQLWKKVDFILALACLFADRPVKFALNRCVILMLSRSQNKHLKFLLTNRDRLLNEDMSLAELKMLLAEPYFRDLYEFQRAIQKAQKKDVSALISLRKRIKHLGDVELKPRPLLNGHDLIQLGAVPGPGLGQLTEEMYIAQLEGKLQKAKDAEQWVLKWLQKHREIPKQRRPIK